jgi:hypothetical protein
MANMIAQAYDHMTHGSAELSMTERGISLVAGLALAAAGAKPRPNVLLNVLALGPAPTSPIAAPRATAP